MLEDGVEVERYIVDSVSPSWANLTATIKCSGVLSKADQVITGQLYDYTKNIVDIISDVLGACGVSCGPLPAGLNSSTTCDDASP